MYQESSPRFNKKVFVGSLAVVAMIGMLAAYALLSRPSVSPAALIQFQSEEEEFQAFMKKYSKQYANEVEYGARMKIYRDNAAYIRLFNSMGNNYVLGVNEFADLLKEEFSNLYLRKIEYEPKDIPFEEPDSIPASVDWRTKHAVTDVKNQGQCGSCWAFSTVGAIEGAWAIAKGDLVSLSEQQLVDCSRSYGNYGCNGGLMDNGFKYVIDHGLTSESNYPYTARDGNCDSSKVADEVASIFGYHDVTQNNPTALKTAIASQPVSVAVEADQSAWQFYYGGVVDSGCGDSLDHGVLAVGYETSSAPNYYWVKNSWGHSWGLNGYIKIAITSSKGMCGIQMQPSYPEV